MTVTMYKRHNVLGGFHSNAKNITERICRIHRTGNAKVRLCFPFRESRRIVIAALISASTAVDTGQTRADIL